MRDVNEDRRFTLVHSYFNYLRVNNLVWRWLKVPRFCRGHLLELIEVEFGVCVLQRGRTSLLLMDMKVSILRKWLGR